MSIQTHVTAARNRLRLAGLSAPEADLSARLLAEHVLGWGTATYLSSAHEAEPSGFVDRYEPLVARREAREPLSYITGTREFWALSFEVSPAVLIPRAETELIVEAALEVIPPGEPMEIVDACTGSGVVAIALACERPAARVMATDISKDAIEVARRNAERHGVADRVRFVVGDLLEPITAPVDVILCNPPYVVDNAQPVLQPEVRDHEPAVAIFGGFDGLQLLTRMVRSAPARLKSGGSLIFEFGYGQDEEVEALVRSEPGLEFLDLRRDLQGIARTCIARRR
jgi:release factor glutamine methyltransferase